MSNPSAHIERDVNDAIEFVRNSDAPLTWIQETDADFYEGLAGYPDETIVNGLYSGLFKPERNQVAVGTAEELKVGISVIYTHTGGIVPESFISEYVQHEKQHAIAIRHAGVTAMKYGIAITGVDSYGVNWQAFAAGEQSTRPITKLELAAITVIPISPSEGDVMRIKNMGYDSIPDLADRIMHRNKKGKHDLIPVPLSFTGH